MRRFITPLPLFLCFFLGVDWSLTGFRYLQFYSGGSGFVVPVPGAVMLLLFCGLVTVFASILSIWYRRFGAGLCVAVLVVMMATTTVQTILHAQPLAVLLRRSGLVFLYLSVPAALYWAWLRKREVLDT